MSAGGGGGQEFRLRQVSLRCLLDIQVVMSQERWMYELEFEEL